MDGAHAPEDVPALRVAVVGAGYWARYQLAGWCEVAGVELVAIANRTPAKAEALAREFGIPSVYDDVDTMLVREAPDALDIVTDVGTHAPMVAASAAAGVHAICQKPLAPSFAQALAMVEGCEAAGVTLAVHENWRWQAPIRALRDELASGVIGSPFRARLQFSSSFPVFENQPFLAREERFMLADVGSHVLDVARFLFGEARCVCCRTHRVNPGIKGEDVATVMLDFPGVTCVVELSYASRLADERFPETFALIEGDRGSIDLGPDYWMRTTTAEGTRARRHPPRRYPWAEPSHDLVHASIVDCHRDIARALRLGRAAETDARDNLRTVQLVEAAYASAATSELVVLRAPDA